MPEPLILKIQADTKGVPEGMNKVSRAQDNMEISSRKASMAIKGLVQDLSQARTGADAASAVLGAFSRVLGTSIAGTAIAIAGKTVIDTFSKISETVEQTRERIAAASTDIKNSGLNITFAQSASEAKRLSDEADNARKNIEKLDKSFLQGLVATITGAREELGKLAKEADDLAQQRLFEGARAERIRSEERAGLEGGQLAIKDVEERLMRELQGVDITTPAGIKAANELRKRAEFDIAKIRQDAANKFDIERAKQELKLIEAETEGRAAARKMLADSDFKRSEEEKKRDIQLEEQKAKLQEELAKNREKLEKEAVDLATKKLDLEERLIEQRKQVVQAEARVAERTIAGTGTGRGLGQRPSSFEVGVQKRAEHAARQAEAQFRKDERRRIKDEMELEAGNVYDPTTRTRRGGREISGFDINRRLEEAVTKGAVEAKRQEYDEARSARAGAQATEETLRGVQRLLEKTLDELKAYASVT